MAVLAVQLLVLTYATYWVTGLPYAPQTWFAAGMLALIVNPQILEPFYPRPVDVVANGLIGLLLFLTADGTPAPPAWNAVLVADISAALLAILLRDLRTLTLRANQSAKRRFHVYQRALLWRELEKFIRRADAPPRRFELPMLLRIHRHSPSTAA